MSLNKVLCFWLLWCAAFTVSATQQTPDILLYQKQKYHLLAGWGHPSPLQLYYSQNNLKYPFSMMSTANYRGHIATWQVEQQQLFLVKVDIGKGPQAPQGFFAKPTASVKTLPSGVWADWFSGVLYGRANAPGAKSAQEIYLHVRHGKVLAVQTVDGTVANHQEHAKKTNDKATQDKHKALEAMVAMHQRYMAYYLRQGSNDIIRFTEGAGLLQGNQGVSPVLTYFNNDPMQWPYNWENEQLSGVPGGHWTVDGNRLYLTAINLYYGLNIFTAEKKPLALSALFKDKVINERVFAQWVSGVFIAEIGDEQAQASLSDRMTEFKAVGAKIFSINQGVVEQSFDLPKGFNPLAEEVKLPTKPMQLFKQWQIQMFGS